MSDVSTEPLGPIDYLVVEFPGNKFNGEVLPALTDLIARGLVRILDLAYVSKDADGNVVILELEDLAGEVGVLAGLSAFLCDLVSEEDLIAAAAVLQPNSSAAVLIWENTWAAPFTAALRGSGAEVISTGRLAGMDVLGALEELGAPALTNDGGS